MSPAQMEILNRFKRPTTHVDVTLGKTMRGFGAGNVTPSFLEGTDWFSSSSGFMDCYGGMRKHVSRVVKSRGIVFPQSDIAVLTGRRAG